MDWRRTIVFVSFLCVVFECNLYASPELWVQRYNPSGGGTDYASAITKDSSGNFYVTGNCSCIDTLNSTAYKDYATIKYDSSGNKLWVQRYNGPDSYDDRASAIAVDSSGNVYVTGNSNQYSDGNSDFATVKYDSSGNQLWVQRYNGSANYEDSSRAIAVDSSGNVYVTGYSSSSSINLDCTTIKYDSSGNQVWINTYSGAGLGYDSCQAIALDSAGNVYVTGYCTGSGDNYDYVTIKYDSLGNQIWVQTYNGPSNNADIVNAITVDSQDNVYVTGYSTGSGTGTDYTTIKYDSSGNQLWVQSYNGSGNGSDSAYDITLDSSGNVYVTGSSAGSGTGIDYATIKYDSSGNQLWIQTYNGPTNSSDYAKALDIDSSGNVYVTGYSSGSGTGTDYATIKYDSSGNQLWAQRYNGPANGADSANAIAVDLMGSVCVTGNSTISGANTDYTTIKYDSSGNQIWLDKFDGPGCRGEEAAAIAMDAIGNVYVTGTSTKSSAYDGIYESVKYDSSGNELWAKSCSCGGKARAMAVDSLGNIHITGYYGSYYNVDCTTIKYDSLGNLLWRKNYGSYLSSELGYAIALDSSGNSYVAGSASGCALIKYDSLGNENWIRSYLGSGDSSGTAYAITLDAVGNIYVAGSNYDSTFDCITIKYDYAGNRKWIQRYNGSSNNFDRIIAVAVDPSGSVYVTGYSYDNTTNYDYLTIKYDASGNQLWTQRYNGPGNGDDRALAMVVDSSGNVYVTGYSTGSGTGTDYATIKYDSSGNQLWVQRYNGPSSNADQANAIALDQLGNVCVTGYIYDSTTSSDYATIKYDSSGNQVWMQRYNGPGNGADGAHAMAVDSSGNVYVTGSSAGIQTGGDYATIKYDGAPPDGSLLIDDGAQYCLSTNVMLTLNATDNANGVARMRFSNDGSAWSDWEDYGTSKAWTLDGEDGAKTVCVQYKDGVGNVSANVADSITLHTGPNPIVESVSVSPTLVAAGDTVYVSVIAVDISGISSVTADGTPLVNTSGNIWSGEVTADSALGSHSINIIATNVPGYSTSALGSYTTTTILGATGKSLADPIMAQASQKWLFIAWGKVTIVDSQSFDLDDGSGTIIRIVAPGYSGLVNGDYASARGLSALTSPIILTCDPVNVKKRN